MKLKIFIFLTLIGLGFGCKTPTEIPAPIEMVDFVHGSWVRVNPEKGGLFRGELIAVEEERILILSEKGEDRLRYLSVEEIEALDILVSLTFDNRERAEMLSTFNGIIPFAHGFFGVITLPINWGVSATKRNNAYRIKYPDEIPWDALHKFSRFPQGLPSAVNPDQIH